LSLRGVLSLDAPVSVAKSGAQWNISNQWWVARLMALEK